MRRWGPGHTPPHPHRPGADAFCRNTEVVKRSCSDQFDRRSGRVSVTCAKSLCFSVRLGFGSRAGVVGASGVLLEGLFVRDRCPERGIRVARLLLARLEGGCWSLGIFVSLDPWGASGGAPVLPHRFQDLQMLHVSSRLAVPKLWAVCAWESLGHRARGLREGSSVWSLQNHGDLSRDVQTVSSSGRQRRHSPRSCLPLRG